MESHNIQKIDQETGASTGEKAVFEFQGGKLPLHINKREDVGHPLVPEVESEYIMRDSYGTTDLETISFTINDPDFFTMLEGEAGVGKNMAIDTLAAISNTPRVRVNFGIGTNYSNLVGRFAPSESDSDEEGVVERSEAILKLGQRLFEQHENMSMEKATELAAISLPQGNSFEWVDGLLTRAVKNGWWFVADEISTAEEEAIMPLNGVTESHDTRYLTIEELSEVITPHPDFRFIATRNPIDYAGVGEMNDALESRAFLVKIGYHDEDALKEILQERTDIVKHTSERALDELIELADDIRTQEQSDNDIITKISTRDLIKVGRMTKIKNIEDATKEIFLGIADPTDENAIEEMINTQAFP